ncbi:hypothetical protein G3I60_21820 [Streptomyces sp. SID13666]|uniref:hypothetical protein n=1 Tax=unclassified Streptomyces TaxID=2593676 RepID=UPI0013C0719B|nr:MULTISPECIES: hypothetical protein [unclassified Streptomyces]NEA56703.1 hypothetical protein [Streptomyces sp. SID13666]NEA73147.1 hypothetical protein [Streptomyces sp. SID13588]
MSRYIDVIEPMRQASDQSIVAFCASCAEQAASLYRGLGNAEFQERFEELLELCWEAAGGRADEDDCVEALEELEVAPELDEDDSDRQEFYAGHSLALIAGTLAASMRPDPGKGELSGQTVETVLSEFDWVLAGSVPRVVRAGDPLPEPGPLHTAALDAQRTVLEAIRDNGSGGTGDLDLTRLREVSRELAAEITRALPDVAAHRGWDVAEA